jgi:transcription factor 1
MYERYIFKLKPHHQLSQLRMSLSFLFRRGFSSTANRCKPGNIPEDVLLDLGKSTKKVRLTRKQTSPLVDGSSPHTPTVVLNTRGSYRKKERTPYISDNRFYLPLDHEWYGAFPTAGHVVKQHACLRNAEIAAQVAEAFVPAGSKDKVIVEAFPGTTPPFWLVGYPTENN